MPHSQGINFDDDTWQYVKSCQRPSESISQTVRRKLNELQEVEQAMDDAGWPAHYDRTELLVELIRTSDAYQNLD